MGVDVAFYIAVAAMAVGEVYQGQVVKRNMEDRNRQLKLESKTASLAAMDEEVRRLQELNYANSDVIARAGNLDPYASPSLIAIQQRNRALAEMDMANIRLNLQNQRAALTAEMAINVRKGRSAVTASLINAAGTVIGGVAQGQKLFTSTVKPGAATKAVGLGGTNPTRLLS